MADDVEVWRPGSFTKNFSWGPRKKGLSQLHAEIRLGFADDVGSVTRSIFRARVKNSGRPDYIPLNFFLFNHQIDGVDHVAYDELVFQAQNYRHSAEFDRLALFAFNLSYVGLWKRADPEQARPALWANAYIREHVAGDLQWNTKHVNANDIEQFVSRDPRYRGLTSRKLSTNLSYLYNIAGLAEFRTPKIKRWWVNSLFLALDRLISDRKRRGVETISSAYLALLAISGFMKLTGPSSLEKDLAIKHLVKLYDWCGGINRFSDDAVGALIEIRIPDLDEYLLNPPNDVRPGGAVHYKNPNILKTIPRACAWLAMDAGFHYLTAEELMNFDADTFVRRTAKFALDELRERQIRPSMTAAELMKITREK
jgi:hypothetical protein